MKALALFLTIISACLVQAEEKPPCCREVAATAPLTDKSIYQLESRWTSDVGREVTLSVFRGRPQIVAMFFASCEYACPIIVGNMKAIEAALPEGLRGKVDFLLVSFDVERDTTEALKAYRAKEQLASARWTLLRGKEDDVRELAALLGVNYQRDARGQFAHSNVITILNSEGEVNSQTIGLKVDANETVTALEKMLTPKPP